MHRIDDMAGIRTLAPDDDDADEDDQRAAEQERPPRRIAEHADAKRGTDQGLDVNENAGTSAVDARRAVLLRCGRQEGREQPLPRKRGRQAADYAACATRSAVCADQFQGMSSSHRAAGQSAAIFPVTSAM
jgi:hypothetical protein